MSSNQTIVAIDVSGSTSGKLQYWKCVNDIVEQNKFRATKYLFWDFKTYDADYESVKRQIKSMEGRGGTTPHCIIPLLNDGDDFILITDGEIDPSSVNEVNNMMLSKKLGSCDAHIISTRPDVSVVCGFTRGIKSSVKTYGDTIQTLTSLTEDDLRIVDDLDGITLIQFIDKYNVIRQVLLNKMIGVKLIDKKLHDSLVAMKVRLHNEFVKTVGSSIDLHSHLSSGCYEDAKVVSKRIIDEYYGANPIKEFTSKFDTLIGIVAGKTDFSVNQYNPIKTNTFATSISLDEGEPEILLSGDVKQMECPIMMVDDAPVIPILTGLPVLYGEEKKVIDQIMKNPLSILSFSHIVDKIKARLSQSIGLFSYCTIREKDSKHPMTRQEMSGCIPLGSNREYVNDATNAIMHLFTGGKILGNVDLYFAVIYFIVTEELPFLSDVKDHITEQMIYRMDHHKTSASLSGLTDLVGTKLLFKEAIWFVLTSGSLYKDNAIIPIRQHVFVQHKLEHLNSLNGYPISEEDISYNRLTRKMLSFLQKCKKGPLFRDEIRAEYQQHLIVDGTYIFLDSAVDMLNEEITKMHYAISTIVDPSKSASSISISDIPPISSVKLPVEINTWNFGTEYNHYPCQISINTCRPLYNLHLINSDDNRTWEDSCKEFYVGHKLLSLNKYFGDYVVENRSYPTHNQFLLYIWKRETGKGSTTLPTTIELCCHDTMREYTDIIKKLNPDDFAVLFRASVSRIVRAKMEKI